VSNALWIGLAAAGYLVLRRDGGGAPQDPRLAAIANTMGDQLNADAIVGDAVDLYSGDWALQINVSPHQLFCQLLRPASRIAFDDLREIDLAYAALCLGVDPSLPTIPKGGAAGCPIGNGEAALKEVNAQFQKEADAAGGTGALLNIVAGIFGVDTKSFDANYGLGRAAKEVESAKFDLSKLSGARVYVPKVLNWRTPLARTPTVGNGADWTMPNGTIAIDPFSVPKNPTEGTDRLTGATLGNKATWVGSTSPNFSGHGIAIRGGLLALDKMVNKTSAGTIDHTSRWGDIGEWELSWNSQLLSCTAALQVRLLARARLFRTFDYIAAHAFKPSDVSPLAAFVSDGSANGPQYCWQYTYRGKRIESIFPPHPRDGATQIVEPKGGGAQIYAAGADGKAPAKKLPVTTQQAAALSSGYTNFLKGR
jgi:hypothetical protein